MRPDRVDYSYRAPDGGTGKVLDSGFVSCKGLSPDTEEPTAPTNVSGVVNPSSTATNTASVSWQPASDNRGVAQYRVLRDGVAVATVSGTTPSYVSSGLSAGATYAFTVEALDAAGNASPASAPANVATPAPIPVTVTAVADRDTYVSASAATKNYGTAQTLRHDADPSQHSYLRFDVRGSYQNVKQARLMVWANNKSTLGFRVHAVEDTNWIEGNGNNTGITYNTAPDPAGNRG